ncbi:MAG: indole-3-glycerol phosphate synthase TrpC [Eubacterium sp.]
MKFCRDLSKQQISKVKAMSDILNTIAENTRQRYEKTIAEKPLDEIKAQALSMQKGDFEFEKALKGDTLSFICEIKKASPSKGIIAEDFPYLEIAKEYENAGASCISCLTEPKWFLGSDEYLKEVSKSVSIPVLRKDFTVNEYQIYEAKVLGAKAVLLICAILDTDTIKRYIEIADSLGMSALVEAHNEDEVKSALTAGARIIGVNNRNLKDFSVDVNNSSKYRKMIPDDVIFVSESGIKNHDDVKALMENGTNAVLIGETLMRAKDKKQKIKELLYGEN